MDQVIPLFLLIYLINLQLKSSLFLHTATELQKNEWRSMETDDDCTFNSAECPCSINVQVYTQCGCCQFIASSRHTAKLELLISLVNLKVNCFFNLPFCVISVMCRDHLRETFDFIPCKLKSTKLSLFSSVIDGCSCSATLFHDGCHCAKGHVITSFIFLSTIVCFASSPSAASSFEL